MSENMSAITIFSDGACSGNPGCGGYCAILKYGDSEKVVSGYSDDTTNNRMELTAVIEGLNALKKKCQVLIVSDSKYVCDAINAGWLKSWKRNGWRKSNNKTVSNVDLWKELDELLHQHDVTFQWIKGHAGYPENERCDKIAVSEYRQRTNQAIGIDCIQTNIIYTHDVAAQIVENIEDIIIKNDIRIPSPEDNERDPDDTGFYGSVYSDILDSVESLISEILDAKRPDTTIVIGEFSGNW